MNKTRRYPAPALEKGLDILEASASSPLSLSELAAGLKRTPSELFRMLNLLEQRAYVRRDVASNCFELTLKLHELAHTHSPVDHLLRAAAQPARALTQRIRESCHLSVLSAGKLMVIFQAESPEPVRLSVEVGYRALPLSTASGKLLVAFLPASEQADFLAADAIFTGLHEQEQEQCSRELAAVRQDGYLIAESTRRTGFDIACIVGNSRTRVLAALGVPLLPGGPNEGRREALLPHILDCAVEIAASLGVTQFPHRRNG